MKTKEKEQAINIRGNKGWSINKIASYLGVAKSTVSLWVRNVEVTKEIKDKLDQTLKFDKVLTITLYKQGVSYQEIADKVGIKKGSLTSWLNRNGYRRKRQLWAICPEH